MDLKAKAALMCPGVSLELLCQAGCYGTQELLCSSSPAQAGLQPGELSTTLSSARPPRSHSIHSTTSPAFCKAFPLYRIAFVPYRESLRKEMGSWPHSFQMKDSWEVRAAFSYRAFSWKNYCLPRLSTFIFSTEREISSW